MHRRFAKFTVCISGKPFGIKKLLSGFTKETVQMKKWGKKRYYFCTRCGYNSDSSMAVRFLEWERKMLSKRVHNWPRWSRFPIQEIYQDASCSRDRSITFYTDMMGLHAFSHISTQRLGTQRKCLCLFSAAHTDRLCCSLLFLSLFLFITFLKLGFVSKCLSNFAISRTVSVLD